MGGKKQQWPADNVERRKVEELIPYARNSRTHSDEQVAQIAASMKEWGWTNPVLIDEEGGIIAGHGRILAANKLGIKEVPCMTAVGWTEAQKKAYILADNQLALNAGWDTDLLKVELGELDDLDFDLDLIGFDEDVLANLLNDPDEGLTDPDDVPEAPVNPVTVEGDVWVLGDHRIICGDSTSADVVDKVLGSVKPHLMVTDPPYGVEYDPTRTSGNKAKSGRVLNDDRADWREAWSLFPGDVAYVWHAPGPLQVSVHESLLAAGLETRQHIIWHKDRFTLGRSHYQYQHEPCWYAVRNKGHWCGARDQTSVWSIKSREDKGHGHGTQKPVECMKRPIENNSSPGQAVYEPFSGSGTTIIAGEMTGRHIYAIELNPAYVDVAIKRWQDFTGKDATLEETGQTFSEVDEDRYDPSDNSKKSYDEGIAAKRKELLEGQEENV